MATKTWAGSAAKKWGTAANWSPAGVPLDGDDVIFDSSDVDNCVLDENTANLNSFTMDTGYTGTFDMSAGHILRIEYTADGSHFTGTQGTFLGATGTIKFSGNWNTSSINFVFTRESCSVEHTGTGTISVRGGQDFNNLTCGASGKTSTILTYIATQGTLTVGAGTLARTGAQYATLLNATTPLVNGGTITCHVVYAQTSAVTVLGTTYGANLWIRLADGVVATMGGNVIVSGDVYVYPATGNWTVTLKTDGYSLTASTIRIGHGGDPTKNGILDCDAAAMDINGNVDISQANSYILLDACVFNFSGNWTNNSTHASWDEGTSVVKADGSAAQTIANNGLDFYDVEVSGTGQKNLTESFRCRHFTAKNNVTVKITDVGVTWTTFASAVISADATYLLTLRSSIDNNQWDMVAGTGVTALRVDVQDSNNTGTSVDATDASNTDSGNNDGWNFGGGIVTLAGSLAGQSALSAQYLELLMEILGTTAGQSNLPATPLKKAFDIVGSLAGQSGVDGAIGLFKLLSGDISGLSNLPDTDMKLLMELLGASSGQAETLVNLGVAYSVLGSISGQSGETAVLKAIKKIIGSLDAQAGLTGDLTIEAVILLEGSIGGLSTVWATPIEILMKMTGTVDAQSGMDGEIKLTMELIGDTGGLSTADAILKASRGLAGDVDALSSLSGTLQSIAYLLGTVAGTSGVDGGLKVTLQLVGVIDGQSVVLGELTQIVSTLIGLTKISSMMSDMLTKITVTDDDMITEIWTEM